jgi:hypothetical protein
VPIPAGKDLVLIQNQSHDMETDGQTTLTTGHQADLAHYQKFHISQTNFAVNNILQYYFGTGEDGE